MKLLIDENIPPKAVNLEGHDLKFVRDTSLGAKDKEIVEIAEKEGRAIITQDSDFGEIYYFSSPEIVIAILEPEKQSITQISELIKKSVIEIRDEEKGLFQVSKERIRVRR